MANALAGLGESVRIEILHMIEQDDCVAVRYAVRSEGAEPRIGAMMAEPHILIARMAEVASTHLTPAYV